MSNKMGRSSRVMLTLRVADIQVGYSPTVVSVTFTSDSCEQMVVVVCADGLGLAAEVTNRLTSYFFLMAAASR